MPFTAKNGIGLGQLQGRDGARPQRQRQGRRIALGQEAKALHKFAHISCPCGLHQVHRHHVLGAHQPAPCVDDPLVVVAIVARTPGLAAPRCGGDHALRVIHQGAREIPLFQSRRIDERLECRARLAHGLHRMVELVDGKVEATRERQDLAGLHVHGHECAFHAGQMAQRPALRGVCRHPDHRTGCDAQPPGRVGLQRRAPTGIEPARCDAQTRAIAQHRVDPLRWRCTHHQGCAQRAAVTPGSQRAAQGHGVVRCDGLGQAPLGPRVATPVLRPQQACAQLARGHLLQGRADGGCDVQPQRIGVVAEALHHQLARLLHSEGGAGVDAFVPGAQMQLLRQRMLQLLRVQMAEGKHALQDMALAEHGTLAVDHRVVGRRGLGQTRQHGGFGHSELVQRLVEVDRRCSGKAVSPLAQIDLVHIQLQQLVLAVGGLQLVGKQHLHQLAAIGFHAAQKEHAGHLHGDGAATLRVFTCADVAEHRARQATKIHAPMRVEIRVLDGQQRLLKRAGNGVDGYQLAALLAVFSQQATVARIDTQGQHGVIVGQMVNGRQLLPQPVQHIGTAQAGAQGQAQDGTEEKAQKGAWSGA